MPVHLDQATAAQFVRIASANLAREYPYHAAHLLRDDADARPPRELHPAFHGSYDWHSCVHMQWTLARCLRRFPDLSEAAGIRALLERRLAPENIAAEIRYFETPGRATFERPYGWGWLLALQAEQRALADEQPEAARWRDALAPLARLIARRFIDWLPRQDYPVRNGAHANSAFALVLALRYANLGDGDLASAIAAAAHRWFEADRGYPALYEPGGDDFLSGGMCEAVLMKCVSTERFFADWWQAFAPTADALTRWLTPITVSDASDAKIVHLHGLNLSRAWCWRRLAPSLPSTLQPAIEDAVAAHLARSLPAALAGDYVGTHWLATFATLALDADG